MVDNVNFLSPLGYRLIITRLPEIVYFLQRVNIPSLNLGSAERYTPFAKVPYPGDVVFNDLTFSFKIDEDLKGYVSIWNWIINLGYPENFDQYKSLATEHLYPEGTWQGDVMSDIILDILDNKQNPKFQVHFKNCWPTSIGDLSLQSTDSTVTYLTVEATFKYVNYVINKI